MKSLRAAYRKIFMPTDGNFGGLEDRLAEVMSAPRRERVERRKMAHIKKTSRNQQKGQLHHQLIENSGKEKTSSNLLAGKTDLVETNADGDIPVCENVDALLSNDDENADHMSNPFSALQLSSSSSNSNELKGACQRYLLSLLGY